MIKLIKLKVTGKIMTQQNIRRHSDQQSPAALLRIDSKALFGNNNEVLILHKGMTYTLKITRFGKLILNK